MPKLKLLPASRYVGVTRNDPIRFYHWPILGVMYRRRVELCLAELRGGERVLEVGFGSGVSFLNLHDLYREIYGLDLEASVEAVAALFRSLGVEVCLQNGNVLDMPYADEFFDAVLLISVLEHLKPDQLSAAFREIRRVLKPGGQVVYGVPVERPLMTLMFRLLGYDIRQHHFSTEKEVAAAASTALEKVHILQMRSLLSLRSPVYEVGHFVKR
ncbi:MAG: class I SAM-dependent methyltransferase [Anaerolineae bacterium]|nr:class I SAM-dependent methyltransferase [Anaerolineae bacterium]